MVEILHQSGKVLGMTLQSSAACSMVFWPKRVKTIRDSPLVFARFSKWSWWCAWFIAVYRALSIANSTGFQLWTLWTFINWNCSTSLQRPTNQKKQEGFLPIPRSTMDSQDMLLFWPHFFRWTENFGVPSFFLASAVFFFFLGLPQLRLRTAGPVEVCLCPDSWMAIGIRQNLRVSVEHIPWFVVAVGVGNYWVWLRYIEDLCIHWAIHNWRNEQNYLDKHHWNPGKERKKQLRHRLHQSSIKWKYQTQPRSFRSIDCVYTPQTLPK